ncbi:hypothetical protein [Sinorhizobium chiapasense]|uniref:Uncharacterized protein n=1 Tax=Sinorhizobium chiapasense TaxID=501572 RepID=A0ABZ2BKK1_9HYPH
MLERLKKLIEPLILSGALTHPRPEGSFYRFTYGPRALIRGARVRIHDRFALSPPQA